MNTLYSIEPLANFDFGKFGNKWEFEKIEKKD
jgi:hypothetical protein